MDPGLKMVRGIQVALALGLLWCLLAGFPGHLGGPPWERGGEGALVRSVNPTAAAGAGTAEPSAKAKLTRSDPELKSPGGGRVATGRELNRAAISNCRDRCL